MGLVCPWIVLFLGWLAGTPVAAGTAEAAHWERRPVPVAALDLELVESFPRQVVAVLRGHLPDACSTIEAIEQRYLPERRAYQLTLSSVRPAEALCAQVVTPFEIRQPVVEAGLVSGELTVEAGEVSTRVTIPPLGEFSGLDLPSAGDSVWICLVAPRLCFSPPAEWRRIGLEPSWESPPFLSARLGVRWSGDVDGDPAASLPEGAEIHASSVARLGHAVGVRFAVERADLWSEHLFVSCGSEWRCELWLEAPSEPLLDAAGEAFWRLVRFAIRY